MQKAGAAAALLGLGATLAAPRVARADQTVWTMAAMEDFPPYNYTDDENFIGIDVDLINEAAALLGITIKTLPLPWPRALLNFESGQVDGIFQVSPTEYRFKHWHMTGPMRMTRLSFMVRRNDPRLSAPPALTPSGQFDINSLSGHRIGIVNGFSYTPAFDRATSFARERSIDDLTSLRKLMLGRVTTILGGAANLRYAAGQLGVLDQVALLQPALSETPRYVGFRRDKAGAEKSARLQTAFAEMNRNGTVRRILAAYGEE